MIQKGKVVSCLNNLQVVIFQELDFCKIILLSIIQER